MVKVYKSAVIPAPIGKVWSVIRDFGGIHKLAAAIAERTDIEGGEPADKVGCVRAIHLKDGGVIRERLIALSDHQHVLTYTILESPLGVHDYVATMHALPVTEDSGTFVEWSAEFGCAQGREAELEKTIGEGVFGGGLKQMKALV